MTKETEGGRACEAETDIRQERETKAENKMVNESERETDAERGRLEKMDAKRQKQGKTRVRETETKTPRKRGEDMERAGDLRQRQLGLQDRDQGPGGVTLYPRLLPQDSAGAGLPRGHGR